MCIPCKEIINERGRHAVEHLDTLRRLIAGPDPNYFGADVEFHKAEDELLYQMALAEVDLIESVRVRLREWAAMHNIPARWVALLERI